jgi:hypothetical protein
MNVETHNRASGFSAQCWITGAAGFTDSDPVAVAPAPGRVISPPSYMFMGHLCAPVLIGMPQVVAFLADGTGATLRYWMYDEVALTWSPFSSPVALTYAGSNSLAIRCGACPGIKLFCQVTANTGVTKIAFMIR